MKSKKIRNLILLLIDICIVAVSSVLALALRFDIVNIPSEYLELTVKWLPLDILIAVCVLKFFRLYNRIWTYISLGEILDVLKSVVVIEAIYLAYRVMLEVGMPRSWYVLDFATMFMMFSCVRLLKRVLVILSKKILSTEAKYRVLIVGAGSAASVLIKELRTSDVQADVICAVDDNLNKKNSFIHGIPIVGCRDDIPSAIHKYDINQIIIAMPSAQPKEIKAVVEICNTIGVTVKILPKVAMSMMSSLSKEVREVRYEDLLGREPIQVNQEGIHEFIKDKTILVTGGGGSIGSELCRQIVANKPKKLIIFDIYENCAYEIQNEIRRTYPEVDVDTIIGSVRDVAKMEEVFAKYKPNTVYHAAAHKHVPLMEASPCEAIKNNVAGTLNAIKLAEEYKVDNFILISTDKAVRPTNIMGASKRICEMILQVYAAKSTHTRFAAVRFGNVLGSNGSVIPLFLKQIENGGPVTVTHKDITRYFMTIPEAVALVLQASLFAKGGEIFVLDMGEPVKIYELAENLIKMKGHVPGKDIQIEVVGLRPGEKLYEELLMDEEGLARTANELIYIGQPIKLNEQVFLNKVEKLLEAARYNSIEIKELTAEICETYTFTDI